MNNKTADQNNADAETDLLNKEDAVDRAFHKVLENPSAVNRAKLNKALDRHLESYKRFNTAQEELIKSINQEQI